VPGAVIEMRSELLAPGPGVTPELVLAESLTFVAHR
jgi:hypothetical protein